MALLRWLTWRFRARTILAVTILILGVVLLPKLLAGVPKLVLVLAGIIGLPLSRELVAGLKPADRLNAENQLRGTMMQGLTGLLVLSGAFVAWQQVQVGQRQLESTTADQRTTQQISREARSPTGTPARSSNSAASRWSCGSAPSTRWSGSPRTLRPTGRPSPRS
jgi:hypothetical protein